MFRVTHRKTAVQRSVNPTVFNPVLCYTVKGGDPKFLIKSDIINNLIRERALVPPKIDYWPHKGFWRVPAVEWAVDALHPDPYIYLSSFRRALLKELVK